jgi:MFS family permease
LLALVDFFTVWIAGLVEAIEDLQSIGYNQGVFSGVLTMPAFQAHMGNYDTNLPADQARKGWLTSILELGAWLGCILSGFMAEVFSRKYGILFATGVFILGVVIQATSISGGHNTILAGRFIT